MHLISSKKRYLSFVSWLVIEIGQDLKAAEN